MERYWRWRKDVIERQPMNGLDAYTLTQRIWMENEFLMIPPLNIDSITGIGRTWNCKNCIWIVEVGDCHLIIES